jgi:hypothetical protein
VTRSAVSAKTRDQIKTHVLSKGVHECDIWSGTEFEEFLRRDAEPLLKRFIEGEMFPDTATDLVGSALADTPLNDQGVLAMMAKLFDRPAFYTPIHQESSLGDFRQAITDTIQALGTGIRKTRDGHLLGRIPSRQQVKDEGLRKSFRRSRERSQNCARGSMNWSVRASSVIAAVTVQAVPYISCRRKLGTSWSMCAAMRSGCSAALIGILKSQHGDRRKRGGGNAPPMDSENSERPARAYGLLCMHFEYEILFRH